MDDEKKACEALHAWVVGRPRDEAAEAGARGALQALPPSVSGGAIVRAVAARARQAALLRDPVPTRVVRALLGDGRPELMLALGFLAHWPRYGFSNRRYPAAFVEGVSGPEGLDWRALILHRMGGELGTSFRLAGSTVRGEGRDAAYLRSALFERAMNLEISWGHQFWAEQIAPTLVDRPIFWLLRQSAERAIVLYGPSAGGAYREFLLEPRPVPPRPKPRRAGPRARAPEPPPPPEPSVPYVRVLHPADLAPAQRAELRALVGPEREPFEQIHRAVYAPDGAEALERMVCRYRDRTIEETVLFGYLRRRGWRRGEIMDYARFFEMHHSPAEAEWRPYIRILPGIYSGGPDPARVGTNRQRVHAIGFQRRATPGPPWGGDFMRSDRGRGPFFADERKLSARETPESAYGERLADVPPAVYSETLRTIEQLYKKGSDAQPDASANGRSGGEGAG